MTAVRQARRDDPGVPELLYLSAAPFYDRFAGGPERARRVVAAIFGSPRHTASFDVCRVAESGGAVVGVLAGFPADRADLLARRFLALAMPRLPPWRWPNVARQLREARRLTPPVPPGSWYVDSLAVAPAARRAGVATALLEDAEAQARAVGARVLALDTTLENAPARAFYAASGLESGPERPASPRAARLLGAAGFVAFRKPLCG